MDLALLQQLRQELLHEEKLSRIWTFFMDHFGDKEEFTAIGEEVVTPSWKRSSPRSVSNSLARTGRSVDLLLGRVAEQHFIHGGFALGGRLGTVIYFEDEKMGLLAVTDRPPAIEAKFARFFGKPIPKQGEPSRN